MMKLMSLPVLPCFAIIRYGWCLGLLRQAVRPGRWREQVSARLCAGLLPAGGAGELLPASVRWSSRVTIRGAVRLAMKMAHKQSKSEAKRVGFGHHPRPDRHIRRLTYIDTQTDRV